MKYILCVVCVSAVAILLATVNVGGTQCYWFALLNFHLYCKAGEDENEMLKGMAADCIEKTGATDDDLNEMVAKKPPTTKSGKCLAFCMMNQFNCVSGISY